MNYTMHFIVLSFAIAVFCVATPGTATALSSELPNDAIIVDDTGWCTNPKRAVGRVHKGDTAESTYCDPYSELCPDDAEVIILEDSATVFHREGGFCWVDYSCCYES